MSKKAYRVLGDVTIPRALYKIGENANGDSLYETEGISYSEGDFVLEENISPPARDRIESGKLDHVLVEADRAVAEATQDALAVSTFAPEHEVEHEALVKAGHNIVSEEDQLIADADVENADEAQAAAKLENSAVHGGSSYRSGPGQFDPEGNKILTADDSQYVEPEKKNPFVAKAEAEASSEVVDYNDQSADDLAALAADRGLNVEGTGANGNVLKSDLVAALEAQDAA